MATELIGQRMTSQRKLLLEIIRDAGGHLDADELFQKAKGRDPRISLSTIYRNLNLLKELDLVAERHFVEDHHHYELKDTAEHHHLVCRSCGEVFEFNSPLTPKMTKDVEETSQFQITDIEINMQGYCPNCPRDMHQESSI
ncbi:MAG: transcriptional repressor [Chloroflexi bacterium]|jgi:Fur family transcriptional regulator, ferric uptake regulator|nr:transcriptional repressor [Chloroflexota bacterium]